MSNPPNPSQSIPQACNGCKRRNSKCDHAQPVCGTCLSSGHECTWGLDSDSDRPPTKRLVESLQIEIDFLEAEYARLKLQRQNSVQHQIVRDDSVSSVTSLNSIAAPNPSHTRPTGSTQPSPWLSYQSEHTHEDNAGPKLDTTYQLIFNIDQSIPSNEQSETVQRSLTCDWSRHLPLLNDVTLTRLEHDIILHQCFTHSTSWLLSIVPQLFFHDMLNALAHPVHESPSAVTITAFYSPLLHCSLLAFATALSSNLAISQLKTREVFAERAKQLLEDELGAPNVCLVQALAMLSGYHSGRGDKETGYMYMGMSIRAIYALGFDKTSIHLDDPLATRFHRKTISDWHYWSIFCQDKIMSLTYHRDCGLPSHYNIGFPVIDSEIDRCSWSSEPNGPSQSSRLTQTFRETCKLMDIAASIVQIHCSESAQTSSSLSKAEEIIIQGINLTTWLSGLPHELLVVSDTPSSPLSHVLVLHIFYWWLHLQLYQSDPSSSAQSNNSISQALHLQTARYDHAAFEIVGLVELYDRWHNLRFFPQNMIESIFTAGTALLQQCALFAESKVEQRHSAEKSARNCVASLRLVAQTWYSAEILADKLEALIQAVDGFGR